MLIQPNINAAENREGTYNTFESEAMRSGAISNGLGTSERFQHASEARKRSHRGVTKLDSSIGYRACKDVDFTTASRFLCKLETQK